MCDDIIVLHEDISWQHALLWLIASAVVVFTIGDNGNNDDNDDGVESNDTGPILSMCMWFMKLLPLVGVLDAV